MRNKTDRRKKVNSHTHKKKAKVQEKESDWKTHIYETET